MCVCCSEVQQFRKEVRDAPEVKFAVQAFAALNSNNFVRFFKLVKSASYLASCILHRYFNQVRMIKLYLIVSSNIFIYHAFMFIITRVPPFTP